LAYDPRVVRDDLRPEDEPSWHDREPIALAGGVAAFALLALLAFAVIQTSHDATNPAPYVSPIGPSGATTTSSTIKTLTSSSYTVPSVQTSQDTGAPVTTSSDAPPPPDGGSPYPEVTTPTTIFNPYATTPSQNAGHV
jgi:hypothetical protein